MKETGTNRSLGLFGLFRMKGSGVRSDWQRECQKNNKEVRKRRPTLFSGSNQRILDTGVKTGDARSERREFESGVFGDEILDG